MQLAVRRANLSAVLGALSTIDTLHNTQPTIQLQLTRQEFAAALELISTSRDILGNETANIECLKHLPAQLDELTLVIEKMLLADFESINLVAEYAGVASSEDWSSLIDLLHERLGKLVSLRSRPADLALVSPRELEAIGRTIA